LIAAALSAATLLTADPAAASAPVCRVHWVGSWAASPSDASAEHPLANQTLRMIIAPHLGGGILRIRMSNRFGVAPVSLGPITIGVAGAGPALSRGSERRITFGSRRSVTIAPGADALSDPVALTVKPFGDLAISVYVQSSVDAPTEHFFTRQTSYTTPPNGGDHSADTTGVAFTRRTTSSVSNGWYFLSGLDVQAPGETGAVVAFGDSITDGFQGTPPPLVEQLATINTNARYPDDLARRLISARIPLSVLNAGITGNPLLQAPLTPMSSGSGFSRFKADALALAGVSDVVVLDGINDIVGTPGLTAPDLIAGYERLIDQAHAASVRIQLGTLTPAGWSAPTVYAGDELLREQVNDWIRAQHLADGTIDFDRAVRDPQDPHQINPPYDGSDHLHFSPAGYRVMADAVALRLLQTPVCTTPPALRISVAARSFAVGRSIDVRISVTRTDGGRTQPAAGVRVTLGGHHGPTDRHGRVVLRVRFRRVGVYSITARGRGDSPATLRVRTHRA
jgi:lysophospholipase L1-like esterase